MNGSPSKSPNVMIKPHANPMLACSKFQYIFIRGIIYSKEHTEKNNNATQQDLKKQNKKCYPLCRENETNLKNH